MIYRVPLSPYRGEVLYMLVDGEDLDWVLAHNWFRYGSGYAARHVRLGPGKPAKRFLHRELLGLPNSDPRHTDHINGDRLDNRRINLRAVSPTLNAQNKRSLPGTSSSYRGVTWDKRRQRWAAQAKMDGRTFNLGRYAVEIDAARAASAWRRVNMPGAIEEEAA